jgi:tetratricopeptide (TPR) repeat protein/tRNA A-37 threonylcarbamoyl transferase component Bud32
MLGRVTDELLERHRRGERPALTDYVGRYPELAGELRALFSALVLMEDVRPGPPPPAQEAPPARTGDIPFQHLGEYRIIRQIGRGGMGVVYEAEQESLGRRVALKVLPPEALRDPTHVQRFQREARAAARLHHTHIVPVFGVGEDKGTHYYVMQYIEGRPLNEVLAELRRLRADGGPAGGPPPDRAPAGGGARSGPNPAADDGPPFSVEVAQSLWEGRFGSARPQASAAAMDHDGISGPEGAASAPASPTPSPAAASAGTASASRPLSDPHRPYAKSVAHVGVQVAEALEYAAQQGVLHRDIKPSNLLLDVWGSVWLTDFGLAKATGTPDLTRTGDLLGTLRYMAPERFQGRADVRSDVYALGLTLYEALALRPAFHEAGQMQLIRQITTGEPPRLDQLNPYLPRDLVTVVHKAMAKDPSDRYQTAKALAEDLSRFLDDRPIVARRLGVLEQAWRLCRRNPTVTALAAALLALVGVAVGGGFWLERQHAEQRGRAREAVEGALDHLPGLRRQGRWTEAEAVLAQAASRLDDAGSVSLRQQLDRARADLKLGKRLEDIWLRWATHVSNGEIDFDHATVAGDYAAAFGEAGLPVTKDEDVVAARLAGSALRDQLIAALDGWAIVTPDRQLRARLLRIARRADPDPRWRDHFRDRAVWEDRRALERLAKEAVATELSPQILTTLGSLLGQAGVDAEPLLRAGQQAYPGDPWVNFHLGFVLAQKRKLGEAIGFFRVALAARPESSAIYHNLALALSETRQFREAITAYHRAIDLDSTAAGSYNGLGNAFFNQGRFDEAIAAYRRAIDLAPKDARAHNNLGAAWRDKGQLEEALTAFRRAIELDPMYATAHSNLGSVLFDRDQLADAIAAYRRAIELDPMYAAAHDNLRNALLRSGRFHEARAATQRWLDLLPPGAAARKSAQQQLGRCERLLALDASLPALLEGIEQPATVAEERELAVLCQNYKRLYAAAARFYAAAFAAQPKLADDLQTQDRYNAACAAALAAAGQGADAAKLGDAERARLHRQALAWLMADVAAWDKLTQDRPQERTRVQKTLRHWKADADLARLRDAEGLATLPAEEREACRMLWATVDDLLQRAGSQN